MTIGQLRQAIADGRSTREAIVTQALERAASPAARAVFTRLYAEEALACARDADRRLARGETLLGLAGLPVTIKDLFDVAGEATESGSLACAGDPPAAADALAVQRLRAAGAAVIGKTNMSELAFTGVGLNSRHGTPVNPADPTVARIPGGSSSGAAVSVALGLAVAGLGSDTGGSIRIPAALCGLVGFKSTQSRVPRAGAMELSRTLDTVCALARSVEDCVAVDGVIADAPLLVRPQSLAGVRLLVPLTLVLDGMDAPVAQAFERALVRLSAAGARLVEVAVPEFEELPQLATPASFAAIEGYAVHRERLESDRRLFDARVALRLDTGAKVLAADYLHLFDFRKHWIARVNHRLLGYSAWVCPTVPIVAPPIASADASDAEFFAMNGLLLRNTSLANQHDGCSFSLPCHRSGDLPVGLMLSAVGGTDAELASMAMAVSSLWRDEP
jgi:aspartyl-tRNA(Asn)/glutamyl-tRNA(Gln) amidotransferase subunit A